MITNVEIIGNKKNERVSFSFFWSILAIVLVLGDQVTKLLAFKFIEIVDYSNLVAIHPFKNYNFAFSLSVPPVVMYSLYAVLIVAILVYVIRAWKFLNSASKFAWVIILAGACSNVGERIITGYVKDFIKFNTGFFNFADVYIVFGIILLLPFRAARNDSPKI